MPLDPQAHGIIQPLEDSNFLIVFLASYMVQKSHFAHNEFSEIAYDHPTLSGGTLIARLPSLHSRII
jgi:hypothetical protein